MDRRFAKQSRSRIGLMPRLCQQRAKLSKPLF
jgi:hypothetical protein